MPLRKFQNELGNTIEIEVITKVIEGAEGVSISIVGPTSATEVHITKMEAEVLAAELGDALGDLSQ